MFAIVRTKWKRQNQLRLEQLRHQASIEKELISASADHSSNFVVVVILNEQRLKFLCIFLWISSCIVIAVLLPDILGLILHDKSVHLVFDIGRGRCTLSQCQLCSRLSAVKGHSRRSICEYTLIISNVQFNSIYSWIKTYINNNDVYKVAVKLCLYFSQMIIIN